MKCKSGHEIQEGDERCTACGSAGEMQKAVCAGCNAEGAPEHAFCGQCGEPMVKGENGLDEAMDALATMHKANLALSEDVSLQVGDDADRDELMKAAEALDDGEQIEGNDIGGLLLKAHNVGIDRAEEFYKAALAEQRAARRENGVIAGAIHRLFGLLREIKGDVDTALVKSVGPRSRLATTMIAPKSLTRPESAVDEGPDMPTIMAKCLKAQAEGRLDGADIQRLAAARTNLGCKTLTMIKAADRGLGHRIEQAIATTA